MYPDAPYPWKAYENESTPRMRECLAQIFRVPTEAIASIEIGHNTFLYAIATPNRVDTYLTEAAFWSDHWLVLHELRHVIDQWGSGELGYFSYVWATLVDGGYLSNRFEIDATNFANLNEDALRTCLSEGESL
jgi:hypothetical protein